MQLQLQHVVPAYFNDVHAERSEIWSRHLQFEGGEYIKIVAPSGSGKSSLMHFLYGLRSEYKGDILYDGKNIRSWSREEMANYRARRISIVFQDLRLFPHQTVLQNIEIKRQLHPFHPAEKIKPMAERLGIGDKLSSTCGICSYGEQQRVSIIRAMMQPFDILLLDEPFSHLDNNNSQKAMELMLEESRLRNATIVFADLERIDYFPFTRLYHL